MKKISMVTCSGELGTAHAPITFEGHFIALCPLCAALAEAAEMTEDVNKLENAQEAVEEAESRVEELESRELRFEELVMEQDAQIRQLLPAAKSALDVLAALPDRARLAGRLAAAITKIEKGNK